MGLWEPKQSGWLLATICICLLWVNAYSAQAAAPVWKISNGEQTLYLGGTIHMLAAADYPLPNAFYRAYETSEQLVFETDTQLLDEPKFQQLLMSIMMYPPGQRLDQVLSEETLTALTLFLQSRDLNLEQFLSYKPSMLSMTLTVMELKRLGQNMTGVDQFFSDQAVDDEKQQSGLETIEQQLGYLATMSADKENELVTLTLRDLENFPEMVSRIKDAWKVGDLAALEALVLNPMQADYPDVYQTLIVTRNQNWLPQIEQLLATSKQVFVMVGALHLAGEQGLLAMLQQRGYHVEQQP